MEKLKRIWANISDWFLRDGERFELFRIAVIVLIAVPFIVAVDFAKYIFKYKSPL